MLYGSNESDQTIFFDINFNDLWLFAEQRYNYLNHLIDLIKKQEREYNKKQTKIRIMKDNNSLNQIHILMEEVKKRSENDYYKEDLNRLKILFSADIKGEKNKSIVEKYRKLLKKSLWKYMKMFKI